MASILVADDARSTCKALETILQRDGHAVCTATSGEEALRQIEHNEFDLLLCDVKMPKMDGLTVLRHVQSNETGLAVVMISGHGDVSTAVEAMKAGAFDYLVKPLDKESVLKTVQKALTMRELLVENLLLRRQVRDQFARAHVIGSSPAWRRVCKMVEQVAPSRATILLMGESGTGKELIAGLLHRLSPRAKGPFIVLNAAAIPTSLLEAELFGHEKGAFTGATQRKPGHFELADGGTLFLDEIGDMPQDVQVKLLRVLQDGTFQRVGGTRGLQVDVRVVAATNKDLTQEVAAGHFRQDLYYRLNVITIQLPPLRARRQDIPLLAAHFLHKYTKENHKEVKTIQQEALRRLQAYDWPGNVRELENVIERAVVLAQESAIAVEDLGLDDDQHEKLSPTSGDYFVLPANASLEHIEREAIVQALERSGGNRQAAARQLGIGPATLYRKFKKYQLS
jgi:DNA-binding NtrC family response regulator